MLTFNSIVYLIQPLTSYLFQYISFCANTYVTLWYHMGNSICFLLSFFKFYEYHLKKKCYQFLFESNCMERFLLEIGIIMSSSCAKDHNIHTKLNSIMLILMDNEFDWFVFLMRFFSILFLLKYYLTLDVKLLWPSIEKKDASSEKKKVIIL